MTSLRIRSPKKNCASIFSTSRMSSALLPALTRSLCAASGSSSKIHFTGEWTTLELARPRQEKKLPVVLSVAEVATSIGLLAPRALSGLSEHNLLLVVCACRKGFNSRWRISIASRMFIHVRKGKGAKDRYVPLPERTLVMMRQYWATHRHPVWLFPARTRARGALPTATAPMAASGLQSSLQGCAAGEWDPETCQRPHLAPFLRHPPARSWSQLASHSSLPGPQFTHLHCHLHPPDPRAAKFRGQSHQSPDGETAVVELAEIFRRHGPQYREKYGHRDASQSPPGDAGN